MDYHTIELVGPATTTMPNLGDLEVQPDGTRLFLGFAIDTWHYIASAIPSSITDKCNRSLVGSKWRDNSCAADVVGFAAIQLNFGISYIDQMDAAGINDLPVPH